jgi:hypothetical protein
LNPNLKRLKKALHPEIQMNIVEQCRIIYEALAVGGAFQGQRDKLATYLEISPNTVYKMQRAHKDALDGVREYFSRNDTGMYSYYSTATKDKSVQRTWLREQQRGN